ncbi:MAG TPA: BBP7 family outer membrane beta-barrel protein [Gemmataceae bacterium]
MAGWLVAASVAVAQSGPPAGGPPSAKKPLSPYYATASTVDWSDHDAPAEAVPELLPPVPAAPVVPAMPAPARSPIRQTAASMPVAQPAAQPSPSLPPPPTPGSTPAAPAPQAQSYRPSAAMPAAPPPSCASGTCTSPCMSGSCNSGTCSPGTCAPSTCPAGGACAPTCNCNPCGPNGPCGPAGRVWGDAELLLWWLRGMNVPPLVTSSPSGTPRPLAGVLGAPTTRVLFGDEKINDEMEAGFRVRAGLWLDDCQTCGLEGSYFFVGPPTTNRSFSCLDAPVLARPFIDVNPGVASPFGAAVAGFGSPNSELVCFPGVLNGTVDINARTEFWGFDANARKNLWCCCDYRLDVLAGYRYLRLEDRLNITENLIVLSNANPAIPQGTTFLVTDRFGTTNDFNGGQIGFAGERRSGPWVLFGRTLVALGNTHSEVTIAGATTATTPAGAVITNAGGLLTQPTNMGQFTSDRFAVVYESQAAVGYQVTDNIRAFISYSFLYWSNVTRAGDQIDLVVNSSQIPPGTLVGAPRPIFQRRDTDFWAQGVSFGVEVRY